MANIKNYVVNGDILTQFQNMVQTAGFALRTLIETLSAITSIIQSGSWIHMCVGSFHGVDDYLDLARGLECQPLSSVAAGEVFRLRPCTEGDGCTAVPMPDDWIWSDAESLGQALCDTIREQKFFEFGSLPYCLTFFKQKTDSLFAF
jgi:hypothetical protein